MAKISAFKPALPHLNNISSFDDFFGTAKKKFPNYLKEGFYKKQEKESIFVYRILKPNRSHTGIIACASLLDFIEGKIKKHENTLAAKEIQMEEIFRERNAVIKPVLLTYPNVLEIDAWMNRITTSQPFSFRIPFEDEEHLFWEIQDQDLIQYVSHLFAKKVKSTYICDGHHRTATAEKLFELYGNKKEESNPYNYLLAGFFAASEVVINNFNRALTSLHGLSAEIFLSKLKKYFLVSPQTQAYRPVKTHEMGMQLQQNWYKLELKKECLPQTESISDRLDVSIFNTFILQNILGISDVRADETIKYIEGTKGVASLEKKGEADKYGASFILYPLALEDMIQISDQMGTLPPKSTFIEPRMKNGFVAQLYQL